MEVIMEKREYKKPGLSEIELKETNFIVMSGETYDNDIEDELEFN